MRLKLPRHAIRSILLFSFVFGCLCILVPVLTVYAVRERYSAANAMVQSSNWNSSDDSSSDFDGIRIYATVILFDISNLAIKYRLEFQPVGKYENSTLIQNSLAIGVSIELDATKTVVQQAGKTMNSEDVSFPIYEGDINYYPFDKYSVYDMYIRAYETTSKINVPIMMQLSGSVLGFQVDKELINHDLQTTGDNLLIEVQSHITRSWTTLFFSGFVFIILWLITAGALMSMACVLYFGFVEPPMIAILATLVFAMPAIRNAQPGVPTIGCISDIAGFFWNMVVVSLCLICCMVEFFRIKYGKVAVPVATVTATAK